MRDFERTPQADLNHLFSTIARCAILHGDDLTTLHTLDHDIENTQQHDKKIFPHGPFFGLDLDAEAILQHQSKVAAEWQIGGAGNRVRFTYQAERYPQDFAAKYLLRINSLVQITIDKFEADPILEEVVILRNRVSLNGESRMMQIDRLVQEIPYDREITPINVSAPDEYQEKFMQLSSDELVSLEALAHGFTLTYIPAEK